MKSSNGSRRWTLLGLLSLLALFVAVAAIACGDDDDASTPTVAPATATSGAATSPTTAAATPTTAPNVAPTAAPAEGEIIVFAASSLTDAFKEEATKFQAANPKATVTFNFAASSALATQINQGAPADVFASADSAQMKVVTDAGSASNPIIFATNLPVVVVPKTGSPVASFSDLAKSGVKLVLAAPEVPIGNYARQILTNASKADGGVSADFSDKVLANLQSNEANVKAVLAKIQLGEGDAGIVYTTDAATVAKDVKNIDIPTQYNVIAQYPIAAVKTAKNAAGAAAWDKFILSADGQAILTKWGFGKPPAAAPTSTSLSIEGLVTTKSTLTADQVKSGTQMTVQATDSSGTQQSYSGVSLASVLTKAGVQSSATQVVFTGSDGFAQIIALADINKDANAVIIVASDGTLRNIIPTQAPRTWVKQLIKIELK